MKNTKYANDRLNYKIACSSVSIVRQHAVTELVSTTYVMMLTATLKSCGLINACQDHIRITKGRHKD